MVAIRDWLRGPASLLALTASYVARRPRLALPGLRVAIEVGVRVRRAPVLRSCPELLVPADQLVEVCSLVSDTHVVAPRAAPCELELDPGQWPWRALPTSGEIASGVGRVLAHVARHSARTVIWCGDEVDTGDAAEWATLRTVIDDVPGLSHRMVPGNHDICFNRPFDEDYDLVRRARREQAYQRHAGPLGEFPLVDAIVGDAGPVTIILLDSCTHRSTHVLSNAIGRFGDPQLDRLEQVLAGSRGPVLCVTHHHVWRDRDFAQPDAWYNTAVDSDRFAEIVIAYRRRDRRNHVLVCHGHRHSLTAGTFGDPDAPVAVVGLPSSTFGDKSHTGQLDGVLRYGVAGLRADGSWGVALHDVGPLCTTPRERGRHRPSTPPSASLRAYALRSTRP